MLQIMMLSYLLRCIDKEMVAVVDHDVVLSSALCPIIINQSDKEMVAVVDHDVVLSAA